MIISTPPPFFTTADITLLSNWANVVYNKNNHEHIRVKNELMQGVWLKTVYWSNKLIEKLDGFETINPRMWSRRGWKERNGTKNMVAMFKPYSWARILRIGDLKDIYFTVGANTQNNTNCIFINIDYLWDKNSYLSEEQKNLCDELIPANLRGPFINSENLHEYSWERLLNESLRVILNNMNLYDSIIAKVWPNSAAAASISNLLIKREIPTEGHIPSIRPRTFIGQDYDWEQIAKDAHETGKIGEELVIKYEKEVLSKINPDWAELVHKVKDGEGFDIESRYEDGSIKYIEVKTTVGNMDTPFYISEPERCFSNENPESYHLYKVFNLQKENKVGEFFDFKGSVDDYFELRSENYKGYRKDRNNS